MNWDLFSRLRGSKPTAAAQPEYYQTDECTIEFSQTGGDEAASSPRNKSQKTVDETWMDRVAIGDVKTQFGGRATPERDGAHQAACLRHSRPAGSWPQPEAVMAGGTISPLPRDLWVSEILPQLSWQDRMSCVLVCHTWRAAFTTTLTPGPSLSLEAALFTLVCCPQLHTLNFRNGLPEKTCCAALVALAGALAAAIPAGSPVRAHLAQLSTVSLPGDTDIDSDWPVADYKLAVERVLPATLVAHMTSLTALDLGPRVVMAAPDLWPTLPSGLRMLRLSLTDVASSSSAPLQLVAPLPATLTALSLCSVSSALWTKESFWNALAAALAPLRALDSLALMGCKLPNTKMNSSRHAHPLRGPWITPCLGGTVADSLRCLHIDRVAPTSADVMTLGERCTQLVALRLTRLNTVASDLAVAVLMKAAFVARLETLELTCKTLQMDAQLALVFPCADHAWVVRHHPDVVVTPCRLRSFSLRTYRVQAPFGEYVGSLPPSLRSLVVRVQRGMEHAVSWPSLAARLFSQLEHLELGPVDNRAEHFQPRISEPREDPFQDLAWVAPQLRTFVLRNHRVTGGWPKPWATTIGHVVSAMSRLERLDLGTSLDNAESHWPQFSTNLSSRLTALLLDNRLRGDGVGSFDYTQLHHLRALNELSLVGAAITDAELCTLATHVGAQLLRLDLAQCLEITATGLVPTGDDRAAELVPLCRLVPRLRSLRLTDRSYLQQKLTDSAYGTTIIMMTARDVAAAWERHTCSSGFMGVTLVKRR